MKKSISPLTGMLRSAVLLSLLLLVWLLLVVVYFEWNFPPFNLFINWLLPWKSVIEIPAGANHVIRLSIMQDLLDDSVQISESALLSMFTFFSLLSIYLTVVYQQKQKKYKELKVLNLKNQEIVRRNEFIQYISATIGHEFKNNLGRIKRRLDLIPSLPESSMERINDNFRKLFADIEIFKKISDQSQAGLVDFINIQLVDLLYELAADHSDMAEISIVRSVDPPEIYASLRLITSVFENLIDNSIKYRKKEQERALMEIEVSMDKDGTRPYVTLYVRDRGIGMNNVEADQCFYKGKESKEGWGQGLYFTKYVIGLHAGRIKVGKEYTAPDAGVEIIINLPFVEEDIYV